MRARRWGVTGLGLSLFAALLFPCAAQDGDGGDNFEGSVELVYQDVGIDGSERKYDEDFDGLDSGVRLGNLDLSWFDLGPGPIGFARVNVTGLGGNPYERSALRIGRQDVWDLSVSQTKQSFLYDLFELVPDEDGHAWDTERRLSNVDLRLFPSDAFTVVLGVRENRRVGNEVTMKDIDRGLFLLDSPVDRTTNSYTAGFDWAIGDVDVVFRQSRRNSDNLIINESHGNLGLDSGDRATIERYQWNQDVTGEGDWTNLQVRVPFGERVTMTLLGHGTFAGEEEIASSVRLLHTGTSFQGTCAASGAACTSNGQCNAILPGDTCTGPANQIAVGVGACSVSSTSCTGDLDCPPGETCLGAAPGFSDTISEMDSLLLGADLSFVLAEPVTLHLEYRDLDREVTSTGMQDLTGRTCLASGNPCRADADCITAANPLDTCAGPPDPQAIATRLDWNTSTATALFELRPLRSLTLRAGWRLIERELTRDGFGGTRDTDFESDEDDTLVFGATWRPVNWFRLNGSYEDGDIDQLFTPVAPSERERARVSVRFAPRESMQFDVGLTDVSNTTRGHDFRADFGFPAAPYDTDYDATLWSASWFHAPGDRVDYLLRWAEQQVDSQAAVIFDLAGGVNAPGLSVYDTDTTEALAQVNFRVRERWQASLRWWLAEADGENPLLQIGGSFPDNETRHIDQDFENVGAEVTYSLRGGLFVGAGGRLVDYDDRNDRLDYEAAILSIRAGATF